jgi:P27 family predicted phage terminase small subunit
MHALAGNPSKKSLEGLEATGIDAQGEPFMPEHLCDDARGCIEVIRRSMPKSVYSALDSFQLAAFGMAWAVHKKAAHEVSSPTFEPVFKCGNGSLAQNPWLDVMNKQAAILASLGDRLGLDPRSRSQLKLPRAKQQKSKFAGLIGQIGSSSLSNDLPSRAA